MVENASRDARTWAASVPDGLNLQLPKRFVQIVSPEEANPMRNLRVRDKAPFLPVGQASLGYPQIGCGLSPPQVTCQVCVIFHSFSRITCHAHFLALMLQSGKTTCGRFVPEKCKKGPDLLGPAWIINQGITLEVSYSLDRNASSGLPSRQSNQTP